MGFSRIPIMISQEKTIICGILLTKQLLCVQKDGKTIYQKLKNRELDIRAPLYMDKDVKLEKVLAAFEAGQSHMGIVCDSREVAKQLRDLSDSILNE